MRPMPYSGSPSPQRAASQKRGGSIGCVFLAIAFLAFVAFSSSSPDSSTAPGATAPAAQTTLSADAGSQCRDLLQKASSAGVIRERPAPNRINVDEVLWTALSARQKDVTLQAVSCDLWQTAMPSELNHVVAYGYRSGKRIQILTSVGMSRE